MSNGRISQVSVLRQESDRERRVFTFQATQLVWLLFGVLESLIALRVLLKLIGANPESTFAAMIYSITSLFLVPFAGLTVTPAAGDMVLEVSSIIAMLVYGLVAWAIERAVWVIFYRP
jgi:YggT family protein